jgi:hypothetical protein
VDFDDVAANLLAVLADVGQQWDRRGQELRLLVQNARQQPRWIGRGGEPVLPETFAGFLGVVDQIVEFDREIANVLPVQRGDEGAIQGAEDAMRDFVAPMLQIAQTPNVALPIDAVVDHASENFRHLGGVLPSILEVLEELLVVGQKPR